MKREKIVARLEKAVSERLLGRVHLKGAPCWYNGWPVAVSEQMVVCQNDVDFMLNGYDAYPIDRLDKVRHKEDKCLEYSRLEGIEAQVAAPEVDVSSWQAFFASFPPEQLVAIEREHAPADEAFFVVGRVVRAGKKRVDVWAVDADSVWQDAPWRIRYEDITRVCFGDRYLTVFQKYAGAPEVEQDDPEDVGQA